MKKFINVSVVLGVILLVGAFSVQAQLSDSSTGSRAPKSVQGTVPVYQGASSAIQSLNGSGQTVTLVKGRGVLTGIELAAVVSSFAAAGQIDAAGAAFGIEFYDCASPSDVNSPSKLPGSRTKIVPDMIVSGNGALSTFFATPLTSMVGTFKEKQYVEPIQFNRGITIKGSTTATNGCVTVYWLK